MATSPAALSSKMSTTIRHLLLRHSSARSTSLTSSVAFSLTGKPFADHFPAELEPKLSTPSDLCLNVGDVRSFGRLDWPVLFAGNHQVAVEAAASGRRKVVPDEVEDSDVDGFDVDDDDHDDDDDDDFDDDDDDDFEDEEEEDKPKRKRD